MIKLRAALLVHVCIVSARVGGRLGQRASLSIGAKCVIMIINCICAHSFMGGGHGEIILYINIFNISINIQFDLDSIWHQFSSF